MVQIAFYGFSALAIGSALVILFTRNVLYAAFCLFLTLLGVAALFILAGADFLAIAQILIYVGGILILLIFGIMLTHRAERTGNQQKSRVLTTHINPFLGGVVAIAIFVVLFNVILNANFQIVQLSQQSIARSTIRRMGISFLTDHVLPFEIAGILLLMVLIGASYLAAKQGD